MLLDNVKECILMSLEEYQKDMERCARCSMCKFIPLEQVKSADFANACPSIARYNFHTYSGGGRLITALAMVKGRIDYTDKLLDIVYQCQTCGACDISCKYSRDMEVLEPIYQFRNKCVENGQVCSILQDLDIIVVNKSAQKGIKIRCERSDKNN